MVSRHPPEMDSIGTGLTAVCVCVCVCVCVDGWVCQVSQLLMRRTRSVVELSQEWLGTLNVQETLQLPVKVEQRAVELKGPTDDVKSMS